MLRDYFNSGNNTFKAGFILVILVLLLAIGLYAYGFRLSSWRLVRQEALIIKGLPAETEIYIDNSLRGRFEGNAKLAIYPGKHDVIVSRAGLWPYLEKIDIRSDDETKETVLQPFLIPQSPDGKLIGTSEAEYLEAISLFNKSAVPLKDRPLSSPNGLVSIYVEDGKIFAVNTAGDKEPINIFRNNIDKTEIEVFDPVTEVKNLAFYKDRDDVLVIAIQDGIFALELDPTVVQNLQPILEGDSPTFRISPGGKFYARDNNLLMLIEL